MVVEETMTEDVRDWAYHQTLMCIGHTAFWLALCGGAYVLGFPDLVKAFLGAGLATLGFGMVVSAFWGE
jgi:hypothetical protein